VGTKERKIKRKKIQEIKMKIKNFDEQSHVFSLENQENENENKII